MMKKITEKLSISSIVLTVLAAVFVFSGLTSCSQEEDSYAEITGFKFQKSVNESLDKDYEGKIEGSTISVAFPEEIYSSSEIRSKLMATISLAGGTSLVGNSEFNFNESPVKISVRSEASIRDYIVVIKKLSAAIENGDLLFTEYYMGDTFTYKGVSNQYLEITNMSDSDIDLSSVTLTRNVWSDGKRVPSKDKPVTLAGVLASKKSFVLYSERSNFTFDAGAGIAANDRNFNSIMTVEGQDGFTLSSNGKILDVLGSDNGSTNRFRWGFAKKLQRKPWVKAYSKWNEDEWLITKATNAAADKSTAGALTTSATETSKEITYFALENLADISYGKITADGSTRKISFNIVAGVSLSQPVTVGSNGDFVSIEDSEDPIVNGVTTIDFSKYSEENPLVLYVHSRNGSKVSYKISFTQITFEKLYEKPKAGDKIIFYYGADSLVMSLENYGTYTNRQAGIPVSSVDDRIGFQDEMMVVTVDSVDDDGYFALKNSEGKFIETSSTGNGFTFKDSRTDYGLWKIEESGTAGAFYFSNKTARYNGNVQYLEYYQGFRFGAFNNSYAYEYQIQFYKMK